MKRTLRLRAEVLTELTPDELGAVVGADEAVTIDTVCYGVCPSIRPAALSCFIKCPVTP